MTWAQALEAQTVESLALQPPDESLQQFAELLEEMDTLLAERRLDDARSMLQTLSRIAPKLKGAYHEIPTAAAAAAPGPRLPDGAAALPPASAFLEDERPLSLGASPEAEVSRRRAALSTILEGHTAGVTMSREGLCKAVRALAKVSGPQHALNRFLTLCAAEALQGNPLFGIHFATESLGPVDYTAGVCQAIFSSLARAASDLHRIFGPRARHPTILAPFVGWCKRMSQLSAELVGARPGAAAPCPALPAVWCGANGALPSLPGADTRRDAVRAAAAAAGRRADHAVQPGLQRFAGSVPRAAAGARVGPGAAALRPGRDRRAL